MALVTNKQAFLNALKAADAESRRRFAQRVQDVIYTLHHEIIIATPVWSGSAVANYHWSASVPDFTTLAPIDNGPPGHTNEMPLGPEPRRQPNTELADASLAALDIGNPFQTFWLNNNDPDIMGLELGVLPSPPLQQRSPNGMVRVSLEYVVAKLAAGQM